MKVLIVDDDRGVADLLAAYVEACDHQVVDKVTTGGLDAIRSFSRHRPDVVLLDIIMPKFNGFTVCHELVSRNPLVKVILLSGLVQKTYPSVGKCGAFEYLSKPLPFETLRAALGRACAA